MPYFIVAALLLAAACLCACGPDATVVDAGSGGQPCADVKPCERNYVGPDGCEHPVAEPDGTPCDGGTCASGVCVP